MAIEWVKMVFMPLLRDFILVFKGWTIRLRTD
jgi:hypothetical protein